MPPLAIAAGVAAVGTVAGAAIQSKAAKKAAATQAEATNSSNALQKQVYDQNAATLAPYVQSGNAAGTQINSMLGLGGSQAQNDAFENYRNSTGYQFRLGEGMNALNSGYAGAGVIRSGAAMRGAVEYGQNFASNEAANYMNLLSNQQGVGLSAASAQAGVGQNYANNVSANTMNNAAIQGQLRMNNANNIGSAIGGLGQIGAYAIPQILK